MKTRARPLLMLLVTLPVLLLSWLGWRVAQKERSALREQYQELLDQRLDLYQASASSYLSQVSSELGPKLNSLEYTPQAARDFLRGSGILSGLLLIDKAGVLIYPTGGSSSLSARELDFLERTKNVRANKLLEFIHGKEHADLNEGVENWLPFFTSEGLRLLYFVRDGGGVRAAEINSSALIAGLIAALHDTEGGLQLESEILALKNSYGNILVSLGSGEIQQQSKPASSLALEYPLGAFTLDFYSSSLTSLSGAGASAALNLGLAVLFCIGFILLLGFLLMREQSKLQREAASQVSFVNQVSHEFKTPLTNIRMYAEILMERLDGEDSSGAEYAKIVVEESQRLSRLINNVLGFGSGNRGALKLTKRVGKIESVLSDLVEQFRPMLKEKDIAVELELADSAPCYFDSDLVVQVVSNLISNVEKYAASGGELRVDFRKYGSQAQILVSDKGPGISEQHREKIFNAFYRVSNKVTEGVSGAGIGLTLSRTLAELHGGSLTLLPLEIGTCFKFVFHAPEEQEE